MKGTTIRKIFGIRLQGSVGLALALLNRASTLNWEALWPQIQNAMIGLGAGAIAYLNRQAIAKGLTDLAQRIAAFQPVASPMPGEALTRAEVMPIPYIPLTPTMDRIYRQAAEETGEAVDLVNQARLQYESAGRLMVDIKIRLLKLPPRGPKRCEELYRMLEALAEAGDFNVRSPYEFLFGPGKSFPYNLVDLYRRVRDLWLDCRGKGGAMAIDM